MRDAAAGDARGDPAFAEQPAVLVEVVAAGVIVVLRVGRDLPDPSRAISGASASRMWQQMEPDDTPIELPLYRGRIDPHTWSPPGSG